MAQSIVELPESANIFIGVFRLLIINHKVTHPAFLILWAIRTFSGSDWKNTVTQLMESGVNYEAFIETCASELDSNSLVVSHLLSHYNPARQERSNYVAFSQSINGVNIGNEILENIRDCGDWNSFRAVIYKKGVFGKKIASRIQAEMNTWMHVG